MAYVKSTPAEKMGVISTIVPTFAVSALSLYFGYHYVNIPLPAMPTVLDRLVFTLRCESLEALVIFIIIMGVALVRLNTTAMDPTSRGADRITEVPSRILQNTLEQFVVGCVGKLTLATYLTQRSMKLIPLLVALWCVGRVAFAVGYLSSPMRRAAGFAMTTFSTYVAIGGVAYCCYTSGIGHDLGTVAGV